MTAETAARVKGFLGLCTRAGQLVFGQDACVNSVRSRKVAVVLLDESGSANTRKRLEDACAAHETPLYSLAEELIAGAVGKDGLKVAAIKPGGLASRMLNLLAEGPEMKGAKPLAEDPEMKRGEAPLLIE